MSEHIPGQWFVVGSNGAYWVADDATTDSEARISPNMTQGSANAIVTAHNARLADEQAKRVAAEERAAKVERVAGEQYTALQNRIADLERDVALLNIVLKEQTDVLHERRSTITDLESRLEAVTKERTAIGELIAGGTQFGDLVPYVRDLVSQLNEAETRLDAILGEASKNSKLCGYCNNVLHIASGGKSRMDGTIEAGVVEKQEIKS